MSNVINDYWIKTTCKVINSKGSGTAFLLGWKDKKKFFLITNKHVISENDQIRDNTTEINLLINILIKNESIKREELTIVYTKDTRREHPDPDIDVYIIDITEAMHQLVGDDEGKLHAKFVSYEYLATLEKLNELDVKITDEIFIIGYPSVKNLQHHLNNFPFVRQGILASKIGEPLEDEYFDTKISKNRKRILRGFLIDGGVIPGLSGSPVILKPNHYRQIGKEIRYDYFPPLLLGIVSETRFIFTDNFYGIDYYSTANLGLAFDSITIKETLDLF